MKIFIVTCKSTNCVHNKNSECMAGVITVKGLHATTSSEAKCETYVMEGGYAFDNLSSLHDNEKTTTEKIRCNAGNCIHNENGKCYAEQVQIKAANAACGTFELDLFDL